ncbi:MAG: Gfo/Idh/MocA family oxidoreductase [Planctomycetia bacterium]|nr:Gfo/Idh/MocA family oxidoreductase [Planctomycetia bacterium]
MSQHTRRTFLKTTAAAGIGATFAISGTKASGQVLGANDRIRVAVAGIKGRGGSHIEGYMDLTNVQVAALVDPDSRLFEGRSKAIEKRAGNKPKCYTDIRKALEDKELDVVSIATCNHWHSLMTVWACQAGKHVYVEKPCSHNIFEGRKAVEAARKYKRLVQHGTQQRSDQDRANEMAALRAGKYGKLLVAKGYCCKPRWSIGVKPIAEPPKELDFDIWLGPAPKQPYHENLVHYNWHWFWDFGNGDMGNQGVHQVDVARWGIKDATMPKSVWSVGGRWVETADHKDQGQTPNMILSVFDYGDVQMVFETRGLVDKQPEGATKKFPNKVENEFYTTEGKLVAGTFYPKNGGKAEKVPDQGVRVTPGGAFGSFIAAVRSGKVEDLNADILEGHYSSAPCHLGNISYRLGKPAPFSEKPKTLGDNKEVLESWEMLQENLGGAGVKLAETTYQVGPLLKFDPETEKFIDSDEANKLLTRDYREGFVVPENV